MSLFGGAARYRFILVFYKQKLRVGRFGVAEVGADRRAFFRIQPISKRSFMVSKAVEPFAVLYGLMYVVAMRRPPSRLVEYRHKRPSGGTGVCVRTSGRFGPKC